MTSSRITRQNRHNRMTKSSIVSMFLCCWLLVKGELVTEYSEPAVNLVQYTTGLINGLIPKDYNKDLRPNYGGRPLRVNISLLINDISAISETEMEYKVDFYIRHYWNDHRLTFPVQHNVSIVTLGEEFVKRIWLPDSYFDNAKENNVHKTVLGQTTTLFRIKFNGDILYTTRIALIAQCPMDLTFFPLDQQKCSIEISSYGHSSEELFFRWTAVDINSKIYLPTFRLLGFNKFELDNVYPTGTFTQVYIPALLVVIISWLPFWLDRHDHHARVALGVTTVLTMTTLTTNSSSDFPKISYLKAIDIYLFTSFLMVFLSLIEYAIVGYYEFIANGDCNSKEYSDKTLTPDSHGFEYDADKTKNIKLKQMNLQTSNGYDNDNYVGKSLDGKQIKFRQESVQSSGTEQHPKRTLIKDASIIDQWARWIFPCTFVIFNVIYIFGLCMLVSMNSNHQTMQVKL